VLNNLIKITVAQNNQFLVDKKEGQVFVLYRNKDCVLPTAIGEEGAGEGRGRLIYR
jgi:hypothetical protein